MSYFLNFFYLLVLIAVSPWLICAAIRKGKYREGFAAKLLGAALVQRDHRGQRLWFHAVSVGEVNLLGTLLREIAVKQPDWQCVVSTTTATGYALARKKYPHLTVFYAPLDFSWAVQRAMRRIRPTVLVLAELELWPNLVRAAKEYGAKVAIVNGRLSAKSFRGYQRIGWLTRRVLRKIELIAAQNEEYADRFRRLGALPECVHVTGSLKFDGAQTDRNNDTTRRLLELACFSDDDIVFLAGSTQAPEEELALQTFTALKDEYPRLKLVLVPRHPHRFDEVAAMLDRSGLPWRRRSQLNRGLPAGASLLSTPHSALRTPHSSFPIPHSPFRILLVDTIGELSAWWGTAAIGFVGGSLGSRGGQNMLEPAAYGVATCFGPNTQNFRDVVQMLLAHDATLEIQNGDELTDFVRRCLDEPFFVQRLGERAQTLIRNHRGATMQTLELITRLVARPAKWRQEAA
ncbi:MAG: 3-deoxy-D-manno-octulosonic acid transferase [Pirellulales bacterium]